MTVNNTIYMTTITNDNAKTECTSGKDEVSENKTTSSRHSIGEQKFK